MRKTRFLTQLAESIVVVAIGATGGLLLGGVANAAPSMGPVAINSVILDDHKTTTNLIVAPNSFPQGLPVTLVAIVRPRAAAGTVQFKDGGNNIGDPVTVYQGNVRIGGQVDPNAGAAFTVTSTLAVGTHSLTAVFTPTDTSAYDPSTSPAESLTVMPPILTGLGLPIQSMLRSVLGGVAGNTAGLGSLSQLLSHVLGGVPIGDGADLNSDQLIQSVIGGLHL